MSTDAEYYPGRITGLSDLARFVAPDEPMSVIDALFRFRQGIEHAASALALEYPRAWQAFTAWDRMDYYPTPDQLAERMTWAKATEPPLHEDFGAKPYAEEIGNENRPTDPLIEWVNTDHHDDPAIGIMRCDDVEDSCRGVRLITRSHTQPWSWTTTHVPPLAVRALTDLMHRVMHNRPWEG